RSVERKIVWWSVGAASAAPTSAVDVGGGVGGVVDVGVVEPAVLPLDPPHEGSVSSMQNALIPVAVARLGGLIIIRPRGITPTRANARSRHRLTPDQTVCKSA